MVAIPLVPPLGLLCVWWAICVAQVFFRIRCLQALHMPQHSTGHISTIGEHRNGCAAFVHKKIWKFFLGHQDHSLFKNI